MIWARRISLVFLALLLLAGAGYFALQLFVDRALESHGIRQLLSGKTAKLLDCNGGYLPLKANGRTVWSAGFLGKAAPPRALTELRGSSLWARCNLSELWRAKWRLDIVHVKHLQAAYGEAAAQHIRRDEFGEPPLEPPLQKESPLELDLRVLDAAQLDLYWGSTAEAGGEFRNVHTQFFPRDHHLFVQGEGGTFHQQRWPEARLVECKLTFARPQLHVDSATLGLGAGTIAVSGNFQFEAQRSLDLQLALQHCPIEPFFAGGKDSKVEGEFDSNTRLQKGPEDAQGCRAAGNITSGKARLKNIETLQKVATFTGKPELARLSLSQVSADYDWRPPLLTVKNFLLEARGLVVLKGEFVIKEGKVDGEFQIGLSPEIVEKFPGAREEVFQRSEGGYLWTGLAVSGPLDHLHDNLRPRLVKAAQNHFAKGLLAPILKPGQAVIESIQGL